MTAIAANAVSYWRSMVYLPRSPLPPLPADQAAREFVEWMQEWGQTGEIPWRGPDGIWAWFLTFCRTTTGCQPGPENLFAEALGKICSSRQVSDYETGRRRRLTMYFIPDDFADGPAAEAPEPLRLAA